MPGLLTDSVLSPPFAPSPKRISRIQHLAAIPTKAGIQNRRAERLPLFKPGADAGPPLLRRRRRYAGVAHSTSGHRVEQRSDDMVRELTILSWVSRYRFGCLRYLRNCPRPGPAALRPGNHRRIGADGFLHVTCLRFAATSTKVEERKGGSDGAHHCASGQTETYHPPGSRWPCAPRSGPSRNSAKKEAAGHLSL